MIPFEEAITSATKKVMLSVVHINSVHLTEYFFEQVPVRGVGSGIIFDADGYILTNAHVVNGAEKLEVTLENGEKYIGKVVGADEKTDVALLRIDAINLPVPKFADSDEIEVGQLAIAIGNPLGLAGGPTVTVGVVSATNRAIQTEKGYVEGIIQTDASINPGNSGGPLVNSDGWIMGINTAMVPFAQGIGFSVPINTARKIAEDLIQYGEVRRPYIGITGIEINKKAVAHFDLPTESGIIIIKVMPGSPAEKSGIIGGDIIVSVDGVRIKTMRELVHAIEKKGIGKKIDLEILRGEKRFSVDVIVEKATE